MVKRTVDFGNDEPGIKKFDKPSEGEHLFQVVDIYDINNQTGKMNLDNDTVFVKLEVAIGDELGRTMLVRLGLDDKWKGFFATRLFLKAIGEPHKGDKIDIDTDEWVGKQFYAKVVHNGEYVNIDEYNFDKVVKQTVNPGGVTDPADVAWDE